MDRSAMEPSEGNYADAYREILNDKMRLGLFAKCLSEHMGDEKKAKASYLKVRAEELRKQRQAYDDQDREAEREAAFKAADREARMQEHQGRMEMEQPQHLPKRPTHVIDEDGFSNIHGWALADGLNDKSEDYSEPYYPSTSQDECPDYDPSDPHEDEWPG